MLILAAGILFWLSMTDSDGKRLGFSHRVLPNLLGLVFLTGCGFIFYYRWRSSTDPTVLLISTVILCIISSYFVLSVIANIFTRRWSQHLPVATGRRALNIRSRIFIMFCTVCLVGLCSACSLLYPVNPSVSANTLMTGGRALLAGHHLYLDIYGSTGPVPYFFNAISWMFSGGFTGIFILEIILDGLFFIYLMKLVSLFYNANKLLLAFPLVAFVFFESRAFSNGDTTEEFCLFFLCVSLYIGVRELKANRIPGYSHFFLTGLCIGFILWSQYSLLGFYIGWIVLPMMTMMMKRRWQKLLMSLLLLLAGCGTASLPVLYFFHTNGTLSAFMQSYFVDSLHLTVLHNSLLLGTLYQMGTGMLVGILDNPLLFLQMSLSLVCALRISGRLSWQIFLCFIGMSIGQYGFFEAGPSSALIWNVFGGFAVILYYQLLQVMELTYFQSLFIRIWALMICTILCYYLCPAPQLTDRKKEDFAQIQIASILEQQPDATLLCFDMPDRGFYTYSGLLPFSKYYAGQFKQGSAAMKEQESLVSEGDSDFVLTQKRLSPAISNKGKYALIKSISSSSPDGQEYYLYARNDLTSHLKY